MDCIFCSILEGNAPAEIVYEDEQTLAFMDINPATSGHTLVIPKKHIRNLFDLDEDTACAIMRTVLLIAQAIKESLHPDGMNLIQANEKAGFQSVFHFHFHLIPRWSDDGLRLPWQPEPGDPLSIAHTARSIRHIIEEQGLTGGEA